MPKVARSLHYRQCTWNPRGLDLFSTLSQALNRRNRIGRRIEVVGPAGADHPTCRLVNRHASVGLGLAGSLIEWTDGLGQPIIEALDTELEQMEVELFPAEHRKFIEGITYFFVRGNHVVIAPCKAVGAAKVDMHWKWLLEHSRAMPSGQGYRLEEVPSDRHRMASLLQGVRSVEFSPMPQIVDGAAGVDGRAERAVTTTLANRSLVRKILEWMEEQGTDGVQPASLSHALASPNVKATINISYGGHMPEGGAPMLDTLAQLVSKLDDDANVGYTIKTPSFGQIRDHELRLRYQARVESVEGQPNRGELYQAMSDWLEGLVQSGTLPEVV